MKTNKQPQAMRRQAASSVVKAAESTVSAAVQKSAKPTASEEDIRNRAYQIFQESGCVPGRDMEHWFQAERELRS